MSKKIKIGLVGLGHLGKIHLELIRQIDHFVLSGIYDIDVKRAKSFSWSPSHWGSSWQRG